MPYVITTKRLAHRDDYNTALDSYDVESRRAVTTLDGREVWNALYGVDVPDREQTVDAIAALPESGGTVGPLPDGTVIEVARVEWIDLARTVGISGQRKVVAKPIIDAYNARVDHVR